MKNYKLTNLDIQFFNDSLEEILNKLNIQKHNKTWLSLFLEEALLKYRDVFGENANFSFNIKKRFSILLVELFVEGKQINVLRPEGLDEIQGSDILDNIINNRSDGEILYNYKNGKNIISVSLPIEIKKIKLPGSANLHAIVLAIIVGLLLRLAPAEVTTLLVDDYISPIYSTLMATLKGLMEPVIFISLVIGICAIEDLTLLSTIGKRTLISFLKVSTVIFVIAVITCIFAFPTKGISTQAFNLANIIQLLLTSIPSNIVAPFFEGNMIQIVVLGFVCGIVILMLGEKASTIKKMILEFKFFFFTILDMFVKALPFVVFLSVVNVILTTSVSDSIVVWKLIVTDQLLVIVVAFVCLFYTSLQAKVPIKILFNKMRSIFFTSLTTGSSTAVIPEFYKVLPNDFGIDDKYTNYWIPLSNSFFSPSTIVALIVYAFFSAQTQNIGLSIEWIVILYIMIIQIGMATPRIPGGIIASCSILFSQLGLTNDQLGIVMAANVLILYLDTAVAGIIRCCCAINVAIKQNCIDLDVLNKPSTIK